MPLPILRERRLGFGIVAVVALVWAGAPAVRAQRVVTADEWRSDLDFLVETVAAKHRCPFDRVSRADFMKAAATLRERLPSMGDAESMVGLARLVAMLRDGHSRLSLPIDPEEDAQSHAPTPEARAGLVLRALPVKFYLFSDGLHIIEVTPESRDLLGAKVLRIGRLEAARAVEAVRPVVSYDSETWVSHMAPQFLRIPEVLSACGVLDDASAVPVEIETAGGPVVVRLEALPRGRQPVWVTWSNFPGGTPPLFLRRSDQPFWFEYDERDRLLFAQVNGIQDGDDETLAAFAGRLAALLDDRDVDKLVLDLRSNGGGNNYLNRALVLALAGSSQVNRYGHLFTLTGRATFSAAVSLVSALEQWTETIFVGEPAGNAPSQFGDSRKYQLPASRLTVRLSSVYWRDWSVNEKRPWVPADLKAVPSWQDYAAGRDPALDAARAYAPPPTILERLEERYRWGGMESVVKFYYHYRNSPATAAVRTEEPLIGLARSLEAGQHDADARDIYEYCLREYPRSFEAVLGLGKSYTRGRDRQNAVETLRKALALKPGNAEAAEWLKKAEALRSPRASELRTAGRD